MASKVRFNLKNVVLAPISKYGGTTAVGDAYYATDAANKVAIPGAVSLDLSPNGDRSDFYADGYAYYTTVANNGYDGSLEVAKFPDAALTTFWSWYTDPDSGSGGIESLVESDGEPTPFCLIFQVDGDDGDTVYALLNCIGTRPTIGSETDAGSHEPRTQSIDISARPLSNNLVLAKAEASVATAWLAGNVQIGTVQ